MKIVIVSLLNVLAIGGGVLAGSSLTGGRTGASETPEEKSVTKEAEDAHGADGDVAEAPAAPDGYFPISFTRPFVVPVTEGWRTRSLVVLDLSVDVHESVPTAIPGFSQKARDRIMAALIGLSHDGAFAGAITDPDLQDAVRAAVGEAMAELAPGQVGDVFIAEILERPL